MRISFEKYQGTGNDFILLNNLNGEMNNLSLKSIQQLCDRKFGIGADGLILLNAHHEADFEVDYYNADGTRSFCGNGARCAVAFAHSLGFTKDKVRFNAIDGMHEAEKKEKLVHLKMNDVFNFQQFNNDYILNTGSPHFIRFSSEIASVNMVEIGREIRFSESYKKDGINVNLVEVTDGQQLSVRTYERGVEDETLSCGTGVTAAALIASVVAGEFGELERKITVLGGELSVRFQRTAVSTFEHVWLVGPAQFVFSGDIHV